MAAQPETDEKKDEEEVRSEKSVPTHKILKRTPFFCFCGPIPYTYTALAWW